MPPYYVVRYSALVPHVSESDSQSIEFLCTETEKVAKIRETLQIILDLNKNYKHIILLLKMFNFLFRYKRHCVHTYSIQFKKTLFRNQHHYFIHNFLTTYHIIIIMYAIHTQIFGADPGFYILFSWATPAPDLALPPAIKKFPIYNTYIAFLGDLM